MVFKRKFAPTRLLDFVNVYFLFIYLFFFKLKHLLSWCALLANLATVLELQVLPKGFKGANSISQLNFMADRRGEMETVTYFIFLGSKILWTMTASTKLRRLLFAWKAMTNIDNILKRRHVTLLTKVRIVKVMVFLVVMYACETWTERQRIAAFKLWC